MNSSVFTMGDSKFFKLKGLDISTNPLGVLTDLKKQIYPSASPQQIGSQIALFPHGFYITMNVPKF